MSDKIDCTNYIGIISRQVASSITAEEATAYMVTGCSDDLSVGQYLIVEPRPGDSGPRFLARITEVHIEDVYAVARTPVISIDQEIEMELAFTPRLVSLELVMECRDNGETINCGPPARPAPIHGMVRKPKNQEITGMLGLPRLGLLIGQLSLPTGEVINEDVRLPLDALKHHVLVVGTTGSGKTMLMKNIAYELSKNTSATVLALDVVGHYHHLAMGVSNMRIIYPVIGSFLSTIVKKGGKSRRSIIWAIIRQYLRKNFVEMGVQVKHVKVRGMGRKHGSNGPISISRIDFTVTTDKGSFSASLFPWALETRTVINQIYNITDILTQQARIFYRAVLREIRRSMGSSLTFKGIYEYLVSQSGVMERSRVLLNYEKLSQEIGVHVSTMENMVRSFLALSELGLFDVSFGGYIVKEPRYNELLGPGYVVVDLANLSPQQQRLIVYRLMDKVYGYMGREHAVNRDRIMAILLDEAHLFFPQARSEDEKALMERHLTRITRLGRSRGISVIFATHMPEDLNNAIIQLTNTKMILRSDEFVLESLNVPSKERRFISLAGPGLIYVRSFMYRQPVYIKASINKYHFG
ncbi:MAG: ATP-binding protein [Thermocladium sp.]